MSQRLAPDARAIGASVELLDHVFALVRALALHDADAEPVQAAAGAALAGCFVAWVGARIRRRR